eukprot:CAMPEP_0177613094 /NCGR_PEP_ID=MMETSP0419_2-20121207/21725_1 /TAXON_ID=582737 /ORGANISM="Tetraselmis sp., Strain GSL018" /LENGTH=104 /DNA_ID=CAMNT_0019109635 /DNA_START=80 /DNA_END=395 /DNA_ORIENTATION=-
MREGSPAPARLDCLAVAPLSAANRVTPRPAARSVAGGRAAGPPELSRAVDKLYVGHGGCVILAAEGLEHARVAPLALPVALRQRREELAHLLVASDDCGRPTPR